MSSGIFGIANFIAQVDGDTIESTDFRFFDNNDVAIDLSDVTPKLTIRRGSERGKIVKECEIGTGLSWVDQTLGQLRLSNFLITWGHGTYYYDLEFTYDSGIIKTYVKGKIPVTKQSTL